MCSRIGHLPAVLGTTCFTPNIISVNLSYVINLAGKPSGVFSKYKAKLLSYFRFVYIVLDRLTFLSRLGYSEILSV